METKVILKKLETLMNINRTALAAAVVRKQNY